MLDTLENGVVRQVKSLILSCYGWKRRQQRRMGCLSVQWKDPHSGLWYVETTAMRILSAQLLAPYNRT